MKVGAAMVAMFGSINCKQTSENLHCHMGKAKELSNPVLRGSDGFFFDQLIFQSAGDDIQAGIIGTTQPLRQWSWVLDATCRDQAGSGLGSGSGCRGRGCERAREATSNRTSA